MSRGPRTGLSWKALIRSEFGREPSFNCSALHAFANDILRAGEADTSPGGADVCFWREGGGPRPARTTSG